MDIQDIWRFRLKWSKLLRPFICKSLYKHSVSYGWKNTVGVKLVDHMGFPGGAEIKASACNVGDLGSIPGSRRFPGEGNGNPLQYSCLENPMDGGRCGLQSTGRKESDTTERLHFTLWCFTKRYQILSKVVPFCMLTNNWIVSVASLACQHLILSAFLILAIVIVCVGGILLLFSYAFLWLLMMLSTCLLGVCILWLVKCLFAFASLKTLGWFSDHYRIVRVLCKFSVIER